MCHCPVRRRDAGLKSLGWLAALALWASALFPHVAAAQRVPERSRAAQPPPDAYRAPPPRHGPAIGVGGALDLGLTWLDLSQADERFFAPNGADELGSFAAGTLELSMWVEIAEHVRIGLLGHFAAAGPERAFFGVQAGGLLVEGGFGVTSQLELWGGLALGRAVTLARSRNGLGDRFEAESEHLYARIHGRAEFRPLPWFGLRGTVFARGADRIDEFVTIYAEEPGVLRDAEVEIAGFGALLGLVFGSQ